MLSFLKSRNEAKPDTPDAAASAGWRARLQRGLARTRDLLARDVGDIFRGATLDAQAREALETALLSADVGIAATGFLLDRTQTLLRAGRGLDVQGALQAALLELLEPVARPLDAGGHRPFVIMLAGVNGAGKTTSIGKIAHYFRARGQSVLLAAGDTFRAAAVEQLQAWGERNGVTVIAQQSGDAAAVIFDAVNAARARNIDVVLADTAGRLPTQLHLMEEIRKVQRVIAKALPGAPHEVLLVLDAGTGQNAVSQVQAFDAALGVTGLVLTKLDGSARGGVIAAIARHKPIPVRFIGVGEGLDDLRPFDAAEFTAALVGAPQAAAS